MLVLVAVLILIGLSEVVFDVAFGSVPEIEQVPHVWTTEVPADKGAWLRQCVARLPRLHRPFQGAHNRLRLLNRHLVCMGGGSLLSPTGNALESGCGGGGGGGYALWLGMRLRRGRQVVVVHEDNEVTAENFGNDPPAQRQALLLRMADKRSALATACSRPSVELACVHGADPLADAELGLMAMMDCPHLKYLVLTYTYKEEVERVMPGLPIKWNVLAHDIDYEQASPLFSPFCWFHLNVLCKRVPWVILEREDAGTSAAPES